LILNAEYSVRFVRVFTQFTSYDAIQRPLSDKASVGSQTIWSQTRSYDSVGNVLGLSTVVPTQGGGSATENESFCYDALNRLVWAGNNSTPTGGDHCMAPPTGTTLTPYTQSYSYDNLDRITSSSAGTYTYGDANQYHAVTGLGSVPNPYAAYDAMGNMTCRNTDTTGSQTGAGNTPTGATMSYDAQGQLATWNAPSGTVGSAHYLYDNEGNRVLVNSSSASSTTDTVYFDGYTETVLTGGTTTTTKYYNANGARVALKTGSTLDYLVSDPLGSNAIALNSTGQVIALQHYSPYGTVDYTWGSMPTSYNYAGERLDSQTGLLYDNFRYYDPVSGRFVRSDNVQDNSNGMDPYAYVGDNPETRNDPTGHCPWCIGAIVGGLIGAVVATVSIVHAVQTHTFSLNTVIHAAADVGMGAVDGALITSGVGSVAGAAGIGTLIGAATGAIAHNVDPKHNDPIQSVFESAAMGGITNAIASGLAATSLTLFPKVATGIGSFFMRAGAQGIIQGGAAGFGNLIEQQLSVADGSQPGGFSWNSFLWSVGSAAVIGAGSQGIRDAGATMLRIPPFAKGIAAQAPGLIQNINSVDNVQNTVSAVSQGAAQWISSMMHKFDQ
jgi:RHS repeat-associated protein